MARAEETFGCHSEVEVGQEMAVDPSLPLHYVSRMPVIRRAQHSIRYVRRSLSDEVAGPFNNVTVPFLQPLEVEVLGFKTCSLL